MLAAAEKAGGRIVKPAQRAFWGGWYGYFADTEGHIWEVAHNPDFPIDASGQHIAAGVGVDKTLSGGTARLHLPPGGRAKRGRTRDPLAAPSSSAEQVFAFGDFMVRTFHAAERPHSLNTRHPARRASFAHRGDDAVLAPCFIPAPKPCRIMASSFSPGTQFATVFCGEGPAPPATG